MFLKTILQFHKIGTICKDTISNWSDDNVPRLGASLAFYTVLSLAPLLVISVAVAGLAYGRAAARGQLFWEIERLVGPARAGVLQDLLHSAYKTGTGLIATLLSLLVLSVGASSVMVELRDALNTIWHVPSKATASGLSGWVRLVKERFHSVLLVLGVGAAVIVSLLCNAWIAAMGRFFGAFLPASPAILDTGNFLLSFVGTAFLFAAIYKIVPEVPLTWGDVFVGASVTAFLFEVGKQLIGLYLGITTLGSMYGAAGSLVLFLVWVYYSAQIFFLGAEFTKVYTKTRIRAGKRPATGFFHILRSLRPCEFKRA